MNRDAKHSADYASLPEQLPIQSVQALFQETRPKNLISSETLELINNLITLSLSVEVEDVDFNVKDYWDSQKFHIQMEIFSDRTFLKKLIQAISDHLFSMRDDMEAELDEACNAHLRENDNLKKQLNVAHTRVDKLEKTLREVRKVLKSEEVKNLNNTLSSKEAEEITALQATDTANQFSKVIKQACLVIKGV